MNTLLKIITISTCLIAFSGCKDTTVEKKSLSEIIGESHTVISEDEWYGFHRIKFDFNGRTAWVVEPSVAIDSIKSWTWTMQWAEAYVDRTAVPDLLSKGWHHTTLEAFDTRACDEALPEFARFQKYLVDTLGFAPKANLIGMSWGGFYSTRYACAYPENIHKIYLDAPLMDLSFRTNIGPWEIRDWSKDPGMPVNLAEKLAGFGIPVLLLYGGQDQTVDPKTNCELFTERFKAAGGVIEINRRKMFGHHPHGLDPNKTEQIVNFFTD